MMSLRRATCLGSNAILVGGPAVRLGVGAVLLGATCLRSTAWAQTSFVAPDGRNRYPAVTIFCPSGTGVAPCTFGAGAGGGGGGAVTVNLGGGAVSGSNQFPVIDPLLDGLIHGGALTVGGSVSLLGSPAVAQAGAWSVSLGTGGNAIGSVSVSNQPAVQAVSGAVSQGGSWTVGLAPGASVGLAPGSSVGVTSLPALPTGANAIGSVSVSNLPATQAVAAAALPLPAGAATAALQGAALGPVAPGAATATSSVVIGCVANTTLPTFTSGQQGGVACDTYGRPYVVTVPSANNVPVFEQAVTAGGAVTYRAINAAASAMAAAVKAASGMVYGYEACNSGSGAAFLRLFALPTAPVVGTSVPVVSKLLAAGTCQTTSSSVGLVFNTGIAMDVTSGSLADGDVAAVTAANQVSVEIYYK